jgi:hypothetical protein
VVDMTGPNPEIKRQGMGDFSIHQWLLNYVDVHRRDCGYNLPMNTDGISSVDWSNFK